MNWIRNVRVEFLNYAQQDETVRASCFQRILGNYDALLETWGIPLENRLDSDVTARIIGCDTQMKKIDFLFGLCSYRQLVQDFAKRKSDCGNPSNCEE